MGDDQPFSSDEYCSIVLELPGDDPLFEQKKKMMQSKGFKSKERICLKSSFNSDTEKIAGTIQELLRIARIIQLNEIELDFGEEDEDSQMHFYSPRNELEAFHSILSLIDFSLLNCMEQQRTPLQELREAILKSISDFGYETGMNSVVDWGHNCDKENRLLEWGENFGVISKLQIANIKGAGRGAVAKEDLKVGDIALEIPASLIISEDTVRDSGVFHLLEKMDGMSPETILLLWSMKEKHNLKSRFKFYFDALPEKFYTGLNFGLDAITNSPGTLLFEEIIPARKHLHSQYDLLFPALCNDHPGVFPPELYTWEQFLWACELWYSNSMTTMFPDGELRTCLIPVAGFLNHSLCPHILHYGKVDKASTSLKFCLSRPCKAGEECTLSYGNYSSSHLITFYGFLPQGLNPYDVIPLEIDAVEDSESEEPVTVSTTHMVRDTCLSNNHGLFHYGLPSPFLDHFRRSRNPMLHTRTLLQGNLENELEVLSSLCGIFDGMMENLDDTLIEVTDSENASWDVKLVGEYKKKQRDIFSSVTNSCRNGIEMVKHELLKCMFEDIEG